MTKDQRNDKAEIREKSEKRYQEYWSSIRSPVMIKLKSDIKRIAERIKEAREKSLRILIYGESGVGKDYIADTFFHYLRPSGRIEKYDVGPITAEHAEADLLGVAPGSWSNVDPRPGVFEKGDNGLVFLDEIQNLLLIPQASLLTVINDGTVKRSGGTELIPVTFHLVVGTNVNLEERIQEGTFREDLYYRIAKLSLTVPPLRERKQDIEPLARLFFNSWVRDGEVEIDNAVIEKLEGYDYRRGNIRALESIVDNTSIYAENPKHITLSSLRLPKRDEDNKLTNFAEGIEKYVIFEFYDRMIALNVQDKNEAQRLFDSWVLYHLENNPQQTLSDLESLFNGKNIHKLSFSKLKDVVRRNHSFLMDVVDRFRFEVDSSAPDEEYIEARRKINAYLDQDTTKQILDSMSVEEIVESVSRLITESKISLSDLKRAEFIISSEYKSQGPLRQSFCEYRDHIREMKHLVKNAANVSSDNYGGKYYYLENSELIEAQLKRLISDIKSTGTEFQKQIEDNNQVLSSFDEEKFDPRIQEFEDGPLTEEFADFLLNLKDRLSVSYDSFGNLLEVISGRHLGNVIRYRHLGKNISTSKAYLLKISSIGIGRRVGIDFK